MDSITILKLSFLAPIVILGTLSVTVGALILLRRRPLVINGLVTAWGLILSAVSINLGFFALSIRETLSALLCYSIFILLVQVAAYAAAVRAMRGIFIFGISPEDYRAAIRAALEAVGMPYTETILGYDFSEHPGRLRGPLAQKLGTAQLRLEGVEQAGLQKSIAAQLKVHFEKHRGDYSLQSALIYGGFGIFGLLLAVYQWGRL